jgi:hypothetical protein
MDPYLKHAISQGAKANCSYLELHEMKGDDLYKLYFGFGILVKKGVDPEVLARHSGLTNKMYPGEENAQAYTDLLESYGIGIPVNVSTFKLLVVNELETGEYPGCCGPHLFEYLAESKTLDFYQKFLIGATLLIGVTALEEMMEVEQAIQKLMAH